MTHVALFHSVYGLRPAVLAGAERLRAAGHLVVTPDLYAGEVASSIEEGFALSDRIGWETIIRRARHAIRDMPADTVLAGFSMGVVVVAELLANRRDTAGLLLYHGIGGDTATVRFLAGHTSQPASSCISLRRSWHAPAPHPTRAVKPCIVSTRAASDCCKAS